MSTILSIRVNKTDKNDARGIADVLRIGMFIRVHEKPKEAIDKSSFAHDSSRHWCSNSTYQAEIFDPTHFPNSRSVGAYLGMTSTQLENVYDIDHLRLL